MNKLLVRAGALTLALTIGLSLSVASAHAAKKKVDCDAVMSELNAGKKPRVVAKDLGISVSSVRRCKKKAAAAGASPSAASSPSTAGSPSNAGAPSTSASPGAAAH